MDSYLKTKESETTYANSFCHGYTCANTRSLNKKQTLMISLTNSEETIMTILQCRSPSLTGFVSSRGVGGVQSRVKIKTQNVNWRTGHSGSFLSITVWWTIISCLCVWEIINFRKTKYVKFIPGASDYFCVFKTGNVECDDILKAICYLFISSHFIWAVGWRGSSNLYTNTWSIYSPGRVIQKEMLGGRKDI